jgi:hypothetical protein
VTATCHVSGSGVHGPREAEGCEGIDTAERRTVLDKLLRSVYLILEIIVGLPYIEKPLPS